MHKRAAVVVTVLLIGGCSPALEGPVGGGAGAGSTGGGVSGFGGSGPLAGGGGTGAQGGGAGRTDELTAGTRLKVRAIVGVDGARQQLGFFDSTRMENCSFYTATDGTERCLPLEGAALESRGGEPYFSDSGCTQKALVFYVFGGCGLPARYGSRTIATCPGGNEIHAVSAATQLFYGSPSSCSMNAARPEFALYRSTGILPPADFVQGNFVVEP